MRLILTGRRTGLFRRFFAALSRMVQAWRKRRRVRRQLRALSSLSPWLLQDIGAEWLLQDAGIDPQKITMMKAPHAPSGSLSRLQALRQDR